MTYTRDEDIEIDIDIWLDGPITPERVREEVARMMDEVIEEMADRRRREPAANRPFIPKIAPPAPSDAPGIFPIWKQAIKAPAKKPASVIEPRPWQVGGSTFYFEEPGDLQEILSAWQRISYNREEAVEFALLNATDEWSENIELDTRIGTNCANFVSQALAAGGLPMVEAWYACPGSIGIRELDDKHAWTVVSELYNYLLSINAKVIPPEEAVIGDLVFYENAPTHPGPDHVAIIVDRDENGIPRVVEHGKVRESEIDYVVDNLLEEDEERKNPQFEGWTHEEVEAWFRATEAHIGTVHRYDTGTIGTPIIVHVPDRIRVDSSQLEDCHE